MDYIEHENEYCSERHGLERILNISPLINHELAMIIEYENLSE